MVVVVVVVVVIVEFYFYHNYMGAEGARMARNLGGVPIATMVTPANPINKAQNAHCLASFCLPIVTLATSLPLVMNMVDHQIKAAANSVNSDTVEKIPPTICNVRWPDVD